jgi:hypothetical protein
MSHQVYTADDFTAEEIASRNNLALAVIEEDRQICKYCGAEGQEMETWADCEAFNTMQRQAQT